MAFDLRHLLHYFRLLPDGAWFGGRGGLSAEPGGIGAAVAANRGGLSKIFSRPGATLRSPTAGPLVCLAKDVIPHVGKWDPEPGNLFSLAYHGNGVAMASWAGRAIATVIAGSPGDRGDERPNFDAPPAAALSLPDAAVLYLRGAYISYGIATDRNSAARRRSLPRSFADSHGMMWRLQSLRCAMTRFPLPFCSPPGLLPAMAQTQARAQDLVAEQQPSTVSVVKEGAGIRINTVNRRYQVNVFAWPLKEKVIERQLLIEQTQSQFEADQRNPSSTSPRRK